MTDAEDMIGFLVANGVSALDQEHRKLLFKIIPKHHVTTNLQTHRNSCDARVSSAR